LKNIYLLSLTKTKYSETIYSPTITINFLEKELDYSKINTLIFTSKNGVKAIDKVSKDWKDIPAISVGSKTSEEILKLSGKLLFTSQQFYGKVLTQDIIKNYSDRKFLYIRPKIVASDIVEVLQNSGIFIQETILYETVCREIKNIRANSIIIATSPSTVNCLLKKSIPANSIFIAIGTTTFKAIPNRFQKYIAPHQTIESCINLAKTI